MMLSDWTLKFPSFATRGQLFRRLLLLTLIGGLSLTADPVCGQTSRNDRNQLDTLLQSLIESELERREFGTTPAPTHTPRPAPALSSQNMTRVRTLLDEFAAETTQLLYELNANDAIPGMRPLISDALKIRARAGVLAQKARRDNDLTNVTAEFQNLDREWRGLSHSLTHLRDLPRRIRESADEIERYDRELGTLLKVTPQLDRSELLREVSGLVADLTNLIEDVEIELGRNEARQILVDGHRTQQQANYLVQTIASNYERDRIVADYKQFQSLWYPLAAKLRPYENRYIERSMRRIRSTDQRLHELLRIEQEVNQQQLLDITGVLTKDVDEFFARTPLKLLIELPNNYEVLPTADEFYGVLQNFADVVSRGESYNEMVDAFEYVEDSGELFVNTFKGIRSQSALSVLREIEHSLTSLRQSLQVERNMDMSRAIELAASIDVLAERLDIDTNRWLNRSRVPFRIEALRESATFVQATHHIHEGLVSGADLGQIRNEVRMLFDTWRKVYGYISQCDTDDRARLAETATRITPNLVELRTLLEP